MSTQPRLLPTRRTVLRSAAWSTAAVTVVVATPNIAAASHGSTPPGTASTAGSTRDGVTLNLKSTFTAGAHLVSGLTAVVTLSAGATISAITTPAGWTRTGLTGSTATYTYSGTVGANAGVNFAPVVTMPTNPTSTVTSTIVFNWPTSGTASVSIPLAYLAPGTGGTTASNRQAKNLYPVVTLTAGSTTLQGLTATVVVNTGSDAIVGTWNALAGWTKGATNGTQGVYTFNSSLAPGATLTFNPHMVLDKNPDSNVTAKITLSWTGGAADPVTIILLK